MELTQECTQGACAHMRMVALHTKVGSSLRVDTINSVEAT
jgi:hypothetical protein